MGRKSKKVSFKSHHDLKSYKLEGGRGERELERYNLNNKNTELNDSIPRIEYLI